MTNPQDPGQHHQGEIADTGMFRAFAAEGQQAPPASRSRAVGIAVGIAVLIVIAVVVWLLLR